MVIKKFRGDRLPVSTIPRLNKEEHKLQGQEPGTSKGLPEHISLQPQFLKSLVYTSYRSKVGKKFSFQGASSRDVVVSDSNWPFWIY